MTLFIMCFVILVHGIKEHFVLRCDKYRVERPEFLTSLYEIFPELSNAPDKERKQEVQGPWRSA